jgi:cobyric acid synthase CobQ/L-threonine-O-3-phosphate decarboxylase
MSSHGGDLRRLAERAGRPIQEILDFSANINPLGPPPWLRAAIASQVGALVHYPDPACTDLVAAVSERYGVPGEAAVAGNGSSDIIWVLPRATRAGRAVIAAPAYVDYARSATLAGLPVVYLTAAAEDGFRLDTAGLARLLRPGDIVFIGQPANPTGVVTDPFELRELAVRHPEVSLVVDEAFAGFVDGLPSLARDCPANVVVLLSLTKLFAIPGLRLGVAVAGGGLAARMRDLLPPWSVNALAQAVGARALRDADHQRRSIAYVREQRDRLSGELGAVAGISVYPGRANFLLARLERPGWDGARLAELALREGIAMRVCGDFEGLDKRYFRVAVRTAEENRRLTDVVRRLLDAPRDDEAATGGREPASGRWSATHGGWGCRDGRRGAALMLQGTASNVGKSVLAAGLCRVLLQDGYDVAPFKAMNIALNSFVTRDGGEMSRSQATQALACRLDPDVRMNPVLVKPLGGRSAQVIVDGVPCGTGSVEDHHAAVAERFAAARRAYDALASEHQVMVLEGVGSPAEVNLRECDFANMPMARHAGARVLLVGDIETGGVFAALAGTIDLLDEWQRGLVGGLIVNRFRGEPAELRDALDHLTLHTGTPVLGVVPYLADVALPDEDSVAFQRLARGEEREGDVRGAGVAAGGVETVEVVVVDLPFGSNLTDLDPLRIEPDVRVRVARRAEDLATAPDADAAGAGRCSPPDVVVLPGSRNAIADLRFLRERGLDRALEELARSGRTSIVGICGGLQLLGEQVADPHGLESEGGTVGGLGLLGVRTVLEERKTLRQVAARWVGGGPPLRGYEIHHGETAAAGGEAGGRVCMVSDDGRALGWEAASGRVWGTYLHGLFDADEARRAFLDGVRQARGLEPIGRVVARYDLEPALDRLADAIRAALPVERIETMVGLR